MICKNCGFSNQEGDEFCGNCGQYLEFAGVKAEDTAAPPPAADYGAPTEGPAPVDDQTMAMPVPPADAPPPMQAPPPPPPPAGGPPPAPPNPQFASRGPDVICWNCGRRNPGGRTFCIQCGERLTAGKPTSAVKGGGVAASAAAAGTAPPPDGGGSGNRNLIIGLVAALALIVLVGAVGWAVFLNNPGPTGSPTGVVTPSPGLSPSGSAVFTASPSASPFVTASPSPSPSEPPPSTPPPPPPSTPPPPPPSTPPPTKKPTNAVCSSVKRDLGWTFTGSGAKKTVPAGTAWCPVRATFTMTSGVGLLKIYLNNPKFSPTRYGWLEANYPSDFGGSDSILVDVNSIALPFGYDHIPAGTVIEFKVDCKSGRGTCRGAALYLEVDQKNV